MIRRLPVAAAAALCAVALAVPATAAPVCLQIVDDAGDGAPGAAPGLSRDSLDILSGDVATGKKNLVGALRLKSVAPDPALVGGVVYYLRFQSNGVPHELVYRTYVTGEKEAAFTVGSGLDAIVSPADAVVDASTNTVTWYVARKVVPSLKKPGAKFTNLQANTAVGQNVRFPSGGGSKGSSGADIARGARSYADMTVTCLKGT